MKNVLLLILLVEVCIVGDYFVNGVCLTSGHRIHVVSNLPPDTKPLELHCYSGDDDLGFHTLYPNQEYAWHFCLNFFTNTLFICHLWWEAKDKSFEAFHQKIGYPKDQSWWVARSDGIYFSDENHPTKVFKKYDWNNN